MNAKDVMTAHKVWACAETSDAQSVAQMMSKHNVGAVPVLDDQGRLEGIVTDRDLCCHVLAEGRSFDTPVSEFMSEPVHSIGPDTDLWEVESLMRQYRIRRLPVVDEDRRLKGFISIGDIACHCGSSEQEHELVGVMETIHATSM